MALHAVRGKGTLSSGFWAPTKTGCLTKRLYNHRSARVIQPTSPAHPTQHGSFSDSFVTGHSATQRHHRIYSSLQPVAMSRNCLLQHNFTAQWIFRRQKYSNRLFGTLPGQASGQGTAIPSQRPSETSGQQPKENQFTDATAAVSGTVAKRNNFPASVSCESLTPAGSTDPTSTACSKSVLPTSASASVVSLNVESGESSNGEFLVCTTAGVGGASSSALTDALPEQDALHYIRRITKDEQLLKTVIAQGMTSKSRKKWIEALVETIERELGGQPPVKKEDLQASASMTPASAMPTGASAQSFDNNIIEGSLKCEPIEAIPTDHKEKADQVFRLLDVNHDGLVGLREFRIWFSTYYLSLRENRKPPDNKNVTASSSGEAASCLNDASSAADADLRVSGTEPSDTSFPPAQSPSEPRTAAASIAQRDVSKSTAAESCRVSAVPGANGAGEHRFTPTDTDTIGSSSNYKVSQATHSPSTDVNNATTDIPPAVPSAASSEPASTDMDEDDDEEVEWSLLFHVVLRSSIPYLAFGIIDNGLMLCCGEWIDSTIAVRFCLSSMASAGLGNALSCATGVVTGGFIERICLRSRLIKRHSPSLTPKQALSRGVRNAHIVGSVMGILIGCLIGMFPLLLVPHTAPTRTTPL